MLFVASAPEDPVRTDRYAGQLRRSFENSGIVPDRFAVLDARTEKEAEALLKEANVLFLAGGHVPTQNAFFHRLQLKERL